MEMNQIYWKRFEKLDSVLRTFSSETVSQHMIGDVIEQAQITGKVILYSIFLHFSDELLVTMKQSSILQTTR